MIRIFNNRYIFHFNKLTTKYSNHQDFKYSSKRNKINHKHLLIKIVNLSQKIICNKLQEICLTDQELDLRISLKINKNKKK